MSRDEVQTCSEILQLSIDICNDITDNFLKYLKEENPESFIDEDNEQYDPEAVKMGVILLRDLIVRHYATAIEDMQYENPMTAVIN